MPYKRPTLTELRQQNRLYLQTELAGTGTILNNSSLAVLADADAGMAHLHTGYLDYIAQQTTPFTATDEWLAGWGALKQVYRKAASAATSPALRIRGLPGMALPAGSVLNRSDGQQYATLAEITIVADGTGSGPLRAILPDLAEDVSGGGAAGNADAGMLLTLDANVAGIESVGTLLSPASGGADIEDEEAFRQRVLLAYQNPPQGGSDSDYRSWALAVPGITRAWVKRRIMGAGTVGVYIMTDNASSNGGFPSVTDGVSALEPFYVTKASGDQARVADHIFPLQSDTAVVWVCSPIKKAVDFMINGLSDAGAATVAAIGAALDNVFYENGNPDGSGKIYLSDLNRAIGDVAGTSGYILEQPAANIVLGTGELPIRGEVKFT
ncbi:baseplate J/gp47 family protein [Erwinia amylovora]|uniref:baseplate J/gp47 family protein n=1 Tax=Erwinia amylovora TaxID=552 RepID=UPI00144414F4|nr:baseplate J/gp47 family protein [Erwinia amylovora]